MFCGSRGMLVHAGCEYLRQGEIKENNGVSFSIWNNIMSWFHWQNYLPLIMLTVQFSSVQFSRSVVSDSLRPHESKHARPPCPSPTPGVHSNSCPSSRWCHPAISSSVVPFSSCPQSLPASESFPVSQLFAWGGQSTGVSALASFLPKNTQDDSWCSVKSSYIQMYQVRASDNHNWVQEFPQIKKYQMWDTTVLWTWAD